MDSLKEELCEAKAALGSTAWKLQSIIKYIRKRDRDILAVLESPARAKRQTLMGLVKIIRETSVTYAAGEET